MMIVAQAITQASILETITSYLVVVQKSLSLLGSLVILTGAIYAIYQFGVQVYKSSYLHQTINFDKIRLYLARMIVLGLEFIIASDVIGTTTAPDYYSLGILGVLVVIRTFLNYSLNKELISLTQREQENSSQ